MEKHPEMIICLIRAHWCLYCGQLFVDVPAITAGAMSQPCSKFSFFHVSLEYKSFVIT